MGRFDQDWCDELVRDCSGLSADGPLRMLLVVTDTEDGKVAFSITDDGSELISTAGKLPRGEKADITVTAKEPVMAAIWSGERTRDEAFMSGDIKVEGAYHQWLDEVVAAFQSSPWDSAWKQALR